MRKDTKSPVPNGIHSIKNGWPFHEFDEQQNRGSVESTKVMGNPNVLENYLAAFHDKPILI